MEAVVTLLSEGNIGTSKVNPAPGNLTLEVIHIPSKHNSQSGKDTNRNGGGLGAHSVIIPYYTIGLETLHTLNVGTGTFLGVWHILGIHVGFALARTHVHGTADLVDILGLEVVLVAIGIVVVVILLVSGICVVLLLAADAGLRNDGVLGVRDLDSGLLLEVVGLVGRGEGAGVIGEESEADVTSLLGAVGSEVVNDVVIAAEVILGALEVIIKSEGGVGNIVPVAGVGGSIGILRGTKGNIHPILVVTLAVAVSIGRLEALLVTGVTVGGTLVLLLLHLPGDIHLEELDHIHNVLSVILGASHGEPILARVGRAETESNKSLRLNAGVGHGHLIPIGITIAVFVDIGVPLGNVVTSQEFNGVVGHEGHIVRLGVAVLFDATTVGDEMTAEGRVGGDSLGLDLGEVLLHFGGEGGLLGGSEGGGGEGRDGEH